MKHRANRFAAAFLSAALALPAMPAFAADGVTDKEIKIGSCAALDGPAKGLGLETIRGAKAYIDHVNAQGGVNGRKIKLISKDDGYEPEKAIGCFKQMMDEGVFSLAFFVGTPTAAKYVPLATGQKVPIVGLFTGAQLLHDPFKHYVVNVRASYYDETAHQVNNLWDSGKRKIAVLYQDDAFGAAVLGGVKLALEKKKSQPVSLGSFARNTTDVDGGIKQVMEGKPDAVVLVGAYGSLAEIVKRARAQKWNPLFLTVSFVGTENFIKAAGAAANGVVITQVVPPPSRKDLKTVALYRKLVPGDPTYTSLEGFVDAMILVEGLKRAGKELTREGLISAIESIKDFDMGLGDALKADYGPQDHKAFDQVYYTVVKNGEAVVFDDWKSL